MQIKLSPVVSVLEHYEIYNGEVLYSERVPRQTIIVFVVPTGHKIVSPNSLESLLLLNGISRSFELPEKRDELALLQRLNDKIHGSKSSQPVPPRQLRQPVNV